MAHTAALAAQVGVVECAGTACPKRLKAKPELGGGGGGGGAGNREKRERSRLLPPLLLLLLLLLLMVQQQPWEAAGQQLQKSGG